MSYAFQQGAPGRGRGRGRMMPPGMGRGGRGAPNPYGGMMGPAGMMGRGGRMMHPGMMGRGGRGGRMVHPGGRMLHQGRGRGGRAMMPGRGRGQGGMMGRGAFGTKKPIPCTLDKFNSYIGYIITCYMEREEQESLGIAFPQFTPSPLTPDQQKQLMMKKKQKEMMEFREKNKELKNTTPKNEKEQEGEQEHGEPNSIDNGILGTDSSEETPGVTTDTTNEKDFSGGKDCPENTKVDIDGVSSEEDATEAEKDTKKGDSSDPNKVEVSSSEEGSKEDEGIPPPDPSCPCEPCVRAIEKTKGKESCKCSDCRKEQIKAIKDCDCDRCEVLAQKIPDANVLVDAPADAPKGDDCTKKNQPDKEKMEKMKEMMEKRQQQIKMNLTDCDTLLAKLNTKRLYRRIKYYKRKDPEYDVDKAYPYNKKTTEIAMIEWEALIEDWKTRRKAEIEQIKAKNKEDAEKRAKGMAKRAKKFKKKGGKGKKRSSPRKKTQASAVEEENIPTLEEEGNEVEDEDEDNDSSGEESEPEEECDNGDVEDDKFEYVAVKPSKYELLMFTPCPRAVAVLASYPRSGNSLMRNLYEKITLRVTGSDMMGGLQAHDLVGEMATGTNKCQFVKTHYPERMGARPFAVSRAVLLVRNPYDAMDSYFNLMTTSTHTTSLTEDDRKKFYQIFAEMAKREVLVWRDFHEYWLKQKIPLLVVRYEDLIRDTVKVISKVIRFVLEITRMTFFEERIMRAIGEEQVEKLGPYKARSGGVGRSITKGHYSPLLLQQINHGIIGTMEKFGYKEMLVPNPKQWKLRPLDQHGVYIPGTSKEPMIINRDGLVRGAMRQTNWPVVQKFIQQTRFKEAKEKMEKEKAKEKIAPVEEKKLDLF